MFNRIGAYLKQKRIERQQARERQRIELEAEEEHIRQRLAETQKWQQNILALVKDNKIPNVDWEASVGRPLPFRLLESEHLLYVFVNVQHLGQRTQSEHTQNESVRVVAEGGVSVSVPISGITRESSEPGMMAVTNKHIYFKGYQLLGGGQAFRIAYSNIVAMEPLGDYGVIIVRDSASTHSESFIVGSWNGQFAYELLQYAPSVR